jgi:hypothetical protein
VWFTVTASSSVLVQQCFQYWYLKHAFLASIILTKVKKPFKALFFVPVQLRKTVFCLSYDKHVSSQWRPQDIGICIYECQAFETCVVKGKLCELEVVGVGETKAWNCLPIIIHSVEAGTVMNNVSNSRFYKQMAVMWYHQRVLRVLRHIRNIRWTVSWQVGRTVMLFCHR